MIATALAAAILMAQFSQTATGDLRIVVADGQGMPVQCGVEIVSAANELRETLTTDASGVVVARRLPFGSYRVIVARDGFAPFGAADRVPRHPGPRSGAGAGHGHGR